MTRHCYVCVWRICFYTVHRVDALHFFVIYIRLNSNAQIRMVGEDNEKSHENDRLEHPDTDHYKILFHTFFACC